MISARTEVKYAAYSVEQKRRYYAIRENCRELHDVSRRMTTLLQRADISGRLSAWYFRPGRLRLTLFLDGVFGVAFTPFFCTLLIGVVRKFVVGYVARTGLAQRERSVDPTAFL